MIDLMHWLISLIATLVFANECHHQPNSCFVEEEHAISVNGEPINPFTKHIARKELPLVSNNASKCEVGFKHDIPYF